MKCPTCDHNMLIASGGDITKYVCVNASCTMYESDLNDPKKVIEVKT